MKSPIQRRIGLLLPVVLFVCGQYTLEAQPRGLTPPPNQEDSTAWEGYFTAWEQEAPADAQLWIDRFNHLFNRSRQTRIVLLGADNAERLPGEMSERLILTDSTGKQAGSFAEQTIYDERLLTRAIEALDHGLALHPDRLDMWLGRAAALMYAEHYDRMVESLIRLIAQAEKNKGRWIDTDGTSTLEITSDVLIADYLQDYVFALFNAASPEADAPATDALGQLAAREVAYCPSSPIALNNLASWHYGAGRLGEALTYFTRAAEADPKDPMLHYNIGRLYERQGDWQSARKWWTKLLKSPNEAAREEAKKLLQALDDAEKLKN